MKPRTASRLAWLLVGAIVLELVSSIVFDQLAARQGATDAGPSLSDLAFVLTFFLFPVVGVVLASRRPENALGWLLLAVGLGAFFNPADFANYAVATGRQGVAAAAVALGSWTWVPMIGLSGVFVLLLFPDGHLPSPRWRWFAWVVAIGMMVAACGILLSPGDLADSGFSGLQNPFGLAVMRQLFPVLVLGVVSIPVGVIGAAASLFVRSRRAGPVERQQIRWLASAAAVVAVAYAFVMAATVTATAGGEWASSTGVPAVLQTAAIALFGLLPLSIGVAVLKYRLYDIDIVIRKAVVVGAIAAFFTIVYAAVVGGIGALVQAHSTTTLSFVAAAIVALLFQPVLRRSRRLADRIVYGKRATPYEVLSEFSERVGETYAAEDVLPRMARVVGEGVGASSVRVWLEREGRLVVAASWPAEEALPAPASLGEAGVRDLPGADATFPVEHQGEVLGALAIAMPAADPVDGTKSKLVADLAGQAGLVLRNVRLTEALRARLEELKAAQKRLVAAQDEERRRLERNIHDGAQQQLVAFSVKLRLAQAFVLKEPSKAEELLVTLQADSQTALEDLRDLARGIYPPLLADQGLPAALEAQARRSPVPVEVAPDGVGRFSQEIEAAAYFSCLEALQNVAKYARASHVTIRLEHVEGDLRFEVQDDGDGFDPTSTGYGTGLRGIADRLGALEGDLEVRSAPGDGTLVRGRIPVPVAQDRASDGYAPGMEPER